MLGRYDRFFGNDLPAWFRKYNGERLPTRRPAKGNIKTTTRYRGIVVCVAVAGRALPQDFSTVVQFATGLRAADKRITARTSTEPIDANLTLISKFSQHVPGDD